jgi:transcriptional regulator with XRE-family HTH domain
MREEDATAHELANFLRARRERLSPEMVGLPPRGGGRTPGLRRRDVAQLAGVSTDYVTHLEQGRGARPSAEVVDALARALQLEDDEAGYLHALAGHAPRIRRTAASTVDSLTALVAMLSPLPAMLVDHHFNLRAWNREMSAVMIDFDELPAEQRNIMWLCVMHPTFLRAYCNRAQIVREGVAELRAAWAADPDDVALADLARTLRRESEQFAEMWEQCDVKVTGNGVNRMLHATAGPVDLRYNVLNPIGDRGLRLYVYQAANDASQFALNEITGAT